MQPAVSDTPQSDGDDSFIQQTGWTGSFSPSESQHLHSDLICNWCCYDAVPHNLFHMFLDILHKLCMRTACVCTVQYINVIHVLWFTWLFILLATGRDPARERLLENEKNNFKLVAEKVRYIEAVHVYNSQDELCKIVGQVVL